MRLTDFMPESFKNRKLAEETRSEKTAETPDKPSQSNVEPEPSTSGSNSTKKRARNFEKEWLGKLSWLREANGNVKFRISIQFNR